MEMKLFYKTQREIAAVINQTVDGYWNHELKEEQLIETIVSMHRHNPSKVLKNSDFTTILKQTCGKRRLEVVGMIMRKANIAIK